MKLSIITINRNNAAGLEKTLKSVASQTCKDFEHIIIDGASTDNSVEVIKQCVENTNNQPLGCTSGVEGPITRHQIKWISEPDKGIYNAMNKGIRMAEGEYCQFLNSGDCLFSPDVIERMFTVLCELEPTSILYGNMIKELPNGKMLKDRCCSQSNEVTLNMFYKGCLNHSPAYIKRDLFEKYGLYDETLKICSDWKFYMQSIVLGDESVKHIDIDVTLFDMTGISEMRKDMLNEERERLLEELIPKNILKDYDRYYLPMNQYDRLKRHHVWGMIRFIERVLFKFEKWGILK